MHDLIERQAAIEALNGLCDRECEYSKKQRYVMCDACHLGSAFDVIEKLPPSRENLVNNSNHIVNYLANDTISRQAAIDEALLFLVEYCGAAFDEDMQNKLYQRLILLPSVQPDLSEYSDKLWCYAYERGKAEALDEIVRCKDCKYHKKDECGRWYCIGLRYQVGDEDGSGFCSDAERRADV